MIHPYPIGKGLALSLVALSLAWPAWALEAEGWGEPTITAQAGGQTVDETALRYFAR